MLYATDYIGSIETRRETMTIGQQVHIGRGCQWEQIAPVVKIGKTFANGQTQVWVKMKGGKIKCFHLDETDIA